MKDESGQQRYPASRPSATLARAVRVSHIHDVYCTCLFCGSSLGKNHTVEHHPVGRRLAFDHHRGRLWAVCRRCNQWNLAPLDQRWEAVEECEQRFRQTPLRIATNNIGLARLPDGSELIRIGEPLRPEFAAWRYGDQFGRRRRQTLWLATAGIAAVTGVLVGGVATLAAAGAGLAGWRLGGVVNRMRDTPRGRALAVGHADVVTVGRKHLAETRVLCGGSWGDSWGLYLPHSGGTSVLAGSDALRGAGVLLARINRFGALGSQVDLAVDILQRHRDASTCFRWAGSRPERERYRLARLPMAIRLALEMAAHEETERRILLGELAGYRRRWVRAEEVAGISDGLLLPAHL